MFKIKSYLSATSIVATLSLLMFAWLFADQTSIAQGAFDCSAVTEIPTSECSALVAFYNSTDGDNWGDEIKAGWLQTTTPCSWDGIVCENDFVTQLERSDHTVSGAIPAEIGDLTYLTRLVLSDSKVLTFPAEMWTLTNLTHLDLFATGLGSVPNEIENLTNLAYLNLGGNPIQTLPPEFSNLASLTDLRFQYSSFPTFPPEIGALIGLQYFDYRGPGITSLPPEILNLTNLETLSLFGNDLETLPPEIDNLTKLNMLNMGNNKLTSLPPEIGNLTNLTKLYLPSNPLTAWPNTMSQLTSMSYLLMSDVCEPSQPQLQAWLNGILEVYGRGSDFCSPPNPADFSCDYVTEIPTAECEALVALYNNTSDENWESSNWLKTVTPCGWDGVHCASFGLVSSLSVTRLYLADSGLLDMPSEIGDLPYLTRLHVSNNRLTSLPDTIGNLADTLQILDVSNNPITSWPSSLFSLVLQNFTAENVCEPSDPVGQTWFDATPTGVYYNERGEMLLDSRTYVFCSDTAVAGKIWIEHPVDVNNALLYELGHPDPQFNPYVPNSDLLLEGITVNLTDFAGAVIETTSTDDEGRYAFSGVPFGDYEVTVDRGTLPDDQGLVHYSPHGPTLVALSADNPHSLGRDFVYADGNLFVTDIPATEYDALVAFYNSTDGDNWTDEARTDWLSNSFPCLWEGVTCADGHVTHIILNEAGLSGDIPAEIADLTALEVIVLDGNNITSLPSTVGQMPALRAVSLGGNQLTSIPAELGDLSDLKVVDISDNPITDWPSTISNLILLSLVMDNVCEPSDPVLQTWLDATPTGLYYEYDELIYESRTHVLCSETAMAGKIWYENSEDATLSAAGHPQPFFQPFVDVWLADVTVIATNIETGAMMTTTTDSAGRYAFREIPLGDYEVTLDWDNPPKHQNGGDLSYYWPREANRATVSAETPHAFARDFVYALPFESTPGFCGNPELTIPVDECLALISFYESTDGRNWTDEAQTGWLTNDPPCEWEGVTCLNGHVDSIIFDGDAGLSGAIPATIADLTALEAVVVNDNNITSLPATIGQMSSLRVLILNGNQLTSIPAEIGNLTDLDALILGENRLSAVPPEISNMTNLRNLSLADNQFTSFPPELLDLTNMVRLQLDGNQLTSIPAEIDTLSNLEGLSLGNNQITSFPSTLGNFSQLLGLGLNGNRATTVPAEIGSLSRLQGLNISDNPLMSWPDSFANLTTLYTFGMENVCEPTQPALQAWLDGISELTGRGSALCGSTTTPNQQTSIFLPMLMNIR